MHEEFPTVSGFALHEVYGPDDLGDFDPETQLGVPGTFPYTRGVYQDMYRGRRWTMRQYAGMGTAEESNARYRYLLAQGTTGLSVAFDLPTQMGYDSGAEIAEGEVGKVGVAIDTVEDMARLFDRIPLGDVSTSMTINAPAGLLLLMYEIAAEEQGVDSSRLRGTVQNDVLKEYIARGTYIYPPGPSLRLVADTFAYCAERLPQFNTISISGYHMGEAGATPVQEVAFTVANAIAYVQAALDAGLDIDAFAPRLSFFFVARSTLLEEVAKFRAARRIWARLMKERFGARQDKSMMLRFHTQTAGVALTAQQPEVNMVRVTVQALAAIFGGTQSLHTNSYDEALSLPTEATARLALRTQQVIAHETDVAHTVDPFAGSYAIEALTDRIEAEVTGYLDRIAAMGGAVGAIEEGFQKREIERAAYEIAQAIETGAQVIVGVNRFRIDEPVESAVASADPKLRARQIERVERVKMARDQASVDGALDQVRQTAASDDNLLQPMRTALARRATMQEVCDVLREQWGSYLPRDTM